MLIKEDAEKNCVKTEKSLGVGACVPVSVTDFQYFFTVKWNMVLTLAYNKRWGVDLALLFCNDCQEIDGKAV